ncbi:MAG: hypothetical protein FWC20_12550, partial [Oscillospiraceae bacterium]|nr:hypothetical protein [Oscillospiraceae bacterium]MCL2280215.1 hypothetical protein [Oscillospiraceae bacterium]
MKNTTAIIAVMLAFALTLVLVGCGDGAVSGIEPETAPEPSPIFESPAGDYTSDNASDSYVSEEETHPEADISLLPLIPVGGWSSMGWDPSELTHIGIELVVSEASPLGIRYVIINNTDLVFFCSTDIFWLFIKHNDEWL